MPPIKLYAFYKNGNYMYFTPDGNRLNTKYVEDLSEKYRSHQISTVEGDVPLSFVNKVKAKYNLGRTDPYFYHYTINTPKNYKPPSICDLQAVKVQQGGTCWFHAFLNGWLLSGTGRIVMTNILKEYKKTSEYKKYADINACPMRGRLPLNFFWQYVDHMLKPPRNRTNLNFHNARVIENLGLRIIGNPTNWESILNSLHLGNYMNNLESGDINSHNSLVKSGVTEQQLVNMGMTIVEARRLLAFRNNPSYLQGETKINKHLERATTGGSLRDKSAFNDKIFPSLWSETPDKPILELNTVKGSIKREIGQYILSHSFISIYKPGESFGHAICGYVCSNGKEYIYDSAYGINMQVDWTKPSNISKYTDMKWPGYEFNPDRSGLTYIRKDVLKANSSKVPPPPPPRAPKKNIPPPPPPRAPKKNITPPPPPRAPKKNIPPPSKAAMAFKYAMSTRNFKTSGILPTLKLNKGYLKCQDVSRDVLNRIADEHGVNKALFANSGSLCAELKRLHNSK